MRNRNFAEEIAQQQNLIFTFNHDLVADSLVGRWDSAAYVAFEPAVRGKFKWAAANEPMFSPHLDLVNTDHVMEQVGRRGDRTAL